MYGRGEDPLGCPYSPSPSSSPVPSGSGLKGVWRSHHVGASRAQLPEHCHGTVALALLPPHPQPSSVLRRGTKRQWQPRPCLQPWRMRFSLLQQASTLGRHVVAFPRDSTCPGPQQPAPPPPPTESPQQGRGAQSPYICMYVAWLTALGSWKSWL